MSNDQRISAKIRKKLEKKIRKKRKLEDKVKQAKELGNTTKAEKLDIGIKKLEEDIKKMIKLEGGKLKKVEGEGEEEPKPVDEQAGVEEGVADVQPNPFDDVQQPVVQGQDIQQPGIPQSVVPDAVPQQVVQQPSIPQSVVPGAAQQQVEQQVPPQQVVQQPQVRPQQGVQQEQNLVEVNIALVGGSVLKAPIADTQLEPFLKQLSDAIDSQVSIQIGNQILNGRNILIIQF